MLYSNQKQSALVVCVAAVLLFQLLYLSQTFDAYILIQKGHVQGWRRIFAHMGNVAKVGVLFFFILFLLLHTRINSYWESLLSGVSVMRAALWLPLQLTCFIALLWFSAKIFMPPSPAKEAMPFTVYFLWLFFAIATFAVFLRMLLPFRTWYRVSVSELPALIIALAVSSAVWSLASFTKNFWGPLSDLTFIVSASILHLSGVENLYVDIDAKHLGVGEFIVNIAPACSGYEGIGLVSAFTGLYLYVYKGEFRFPRAFLLFPIGAMCIWFLNAIRICVLILIGHVWSADVAVGGFHSQAGWITFIVTSLGLLWIARASRFFKQPSTCIDDKDADVIASTVKDMPSPTTPYEAAEALECQHALDSESEPTETRFGINLPMAMLMPMAALLAAVLVTSAFAAGFDLAYPLRVLVVLIILYLTWPLLNLRLVKPSVEAVVAGISIALLWVFLHQPSAEEDAVFETGLAEMSVPIALIWMAFRFIGASVTVPIAEELAFRGYLLCRFSQVQISTIGRLPFSLIAVIGSSLAFGALHGAWFAGTLAGLAYAAVRLRSASMIHAIYAHGLTNFLLFIYACYTGVWGVL